MKAMGRVFFIAMMICAAMGVAAWVGFLHTAKVSAAPQQAAQGQWVDPSNPSDELVDGPYRVDPNWPKPLSTLFPEDKGWTWGAVQGIFAQNPDRIFVAMRGELPNLAGSEKQFVDFTTSFGIHTHLEVPGRGMYGRNASVGDYASPGEATNTYKGKEGTDYQWKHIITVIDSQGNLKEAWTQWDSLFKPDDAN